MNRYAAKLLFQYRVVVNGHPGKMRICEQGTFLIRAGSPKEALSKARRRGKRSEYSYNNDEGNPVHFEFVGVLELLHLGAECDDDQVWYDIVPRLLPMERKAKLIPPDKELCAFKNLE